jgi:fucose permease
MPTEILFLVNGIASLLGYNALLTSLDYFNFVYKGYDVYSLFLPPVFGGYVAIVLSYRWLSYKFTYRQLVTVGIILCNIALVMFLLLSLTCR